jgi:CDP-diacylglycerol--glycerol-3-phosphate 3-phosphatidyltransferase
MLARSVPRCATKLRQAALRPNLRYARPQCRRYSIPTSGASPASQSPAALLAPFTVELDKLAPSFKINGSQIHIHQTPAEFYEALKVRNTKSNWQVVR